MRRVIALATAEAVEEAFYDAMQRGDLAAMMALWADDDEVVCVHPNGSRLIGLTAIRDAYSTLFRHGGIDIHPADVRVQQTGVIASHNLIEKLLVSDSAGPRVIECVATNVYAKTAAGWRIILHHAAATGHPPELVQGPGPATLH